MGLSGYKWSAPLTLSLFLYSQWDQRDCSCVFQNYPFGIEAVIFTTRLRPAAPNYGLMLDTYSSLIQILLQKIVKIYSLNRTNLVPWLKQPNICLCQCRCTRTVQAEKHRWHSTMDSFVNPTMTHMSIIIFTTAIITVQISRKPVNCFLFFNVIAAYWYAWVWKVRWSGGVYVCVFGN